MKIENFIKSFKKGFNEKELIRVFTEGNCYHFAVILENLFYGEIVYDTLNGHFLFKHRNSYYDINGKNANIEEKYIELFDRIKMDMALYIRLYKECVLLKSR